MEERGREGWPLGWRFIYQLRLMGNQSDLVHIVSQNLIDKQQQKHVVVHKTKFFLMLSFIIGFVTGKARVRCA